MKTVWFTRSFAGTEEVFRLLRLGGPVRIIYSHVNPYAPGRAGCDIFLPEPDGMVPGPWSLSVVGEHGVDLVVPARNIGEWAALGGTHGQAAVLAAPPDRATADVLDSKRDTFRDVLAAGFGDILPEAVSVEADDPDLERVLHRFSLLPCGCVAKPDRGVGGGGVQKVASGRLLAARMRSGSVSETPPELAAARIRATGAASMVMERLPGTEYSVDVVADRGEVAAMTVRAKRTGRFPVQVVNPSDTPKSVTGAVRDLVRLFRLGFVCNIQFREDADGTPKLLEINPRMSGGLPRSHAAGANLPLAAVLGGDPGRQSSDVILSPTPAAVVFRDEAKR